MGEGVEPMDLTEHKLHSEALLQGDFLHAYRDQVRLPDGSTSQREYVVHPGAVMVVPLLQDPDAGLQIVLERQYRYPVQQTVIECPAGKLDPGESPLACARRELQEETGYTARQWARAGVLHPVVSYSTEAIEVWFARELSLGPRQLDAGEFLEVFTTSPEQFMAWCLDGSITDAKTLVAALWLQNVRSGQMQLDWQALA